VWRKQPIDEKADIWALGVLLYKLCYYTTPFEDVGQMAILNASFKYPSYPVFSDRLKKLIGGMLKEDPRNRPNIYQVIKETCSMRGTTVPIKDIYANRTHSEARRNESLPSTEPVSSPRPIGLQKVAPQVQVQSIPDIAPMRRGRPTAAPSQPSPTAKPANSPARGDPFAALDSKNYDVRAGAVDELSQRFPSLDEFSIALDGGKKFAFNSPAPAQAKPESGKADLSERVTMALADEAFSSSQPAKSASQTQPPRKAPITQGQPAQSTVPAVTQETRKVPATHQPTANRPGMPAPYKSTAVGSSPPLTAKKPMDINNRPIWRVSDHVRSASQPRAVDPSPPTSKTLQASMPPPKRPEMLDIHRSKSQTSTLQAPQAPNSSRPSLEGGRPSHDGKNDDPNVARTHSLGSRSRPASMYVNSDMDYLRNQEQSRSRPSLEIRRPSRQASHSRQPSQTRGTPPDESAITDDMDYLRNSEESGAKPGHHKSRASLNAFGRNIGGRLSGAFKRFEGGDNQRGPRTPEPRATEDEPQLLAPITGSEANKSRHSGSDEETEPIPIEVKRELERQHAAAEERRVAEAAAEYRARVAAQGTSSAPISRASTIQKRVQTLLDEGRQSPVPRKTAEGYGRYTDNPNTSTESLERPPSRPKMAIQSSGPNNTPPMIISPKPVTMSSNNPYPKTRPQPQQQLVSPALPSPAAFQQQPLPASSSAPPEPAPLQRIISRPSAPPKPKALRTGGPMTWPPPQQQMDDASSPPPPQQPPRPTGSGGGLAALLAKDLEGVPDYPPRTSSAARAGNTSSSSNMTRIAQTKSVPTQAPRPSQQMDDDVAGDELESFSKRYPTLSGIEMVETEIDGGGGLWSRAV
jgi:AP2-associated kinase